MLKFINTEVTFAEVPEHISLCINISNCPNHCEGCHSPYLAEDTGTVLDVDSLELLIKGNNGISCVAFMGGDSEPNEVMKLAEYVRKYHGLKTAWYSGKDNLNDNLDIRFLNYIKIGSYKKEYGPLNNRNTNQKFYRVINLSSGKIKMFDITYKFWRNN